MSTINEVDSIYLAPTEIIDSNHPKIRDYAMEVIGTSSDPVERKTYSTAERVIA